MTDTPIIPDGTAEPRWPLLSALAIPYVIFSGVLTVALVLSSLFWLPRVTRVDVGGLPRNAAGLRSYHDELTASILTMQEERDTLVLPAEQPLFTAIKDLKDDLSLVAIRDDITRIAASVAEQPDAVHIAMIEYTSQERTVRLVGDVRFVGPGSMTVLATFVDRLSTLPFVGSVSAPRFERLENSEIGFHSPFDLTLRLSRMRGIAQGKR